MANVLRREKQEQVIGSLVEGASVRATERITGVHRDTIIRLMLRVGAGCEALMDRQMCNLRCSRIQVDEIWGYVAKKQRHVRWSDDVTQVGDFWTFVALDADSKLIPAFLIGKRTRESAHIFMADLARRVSGRIQLSTDSLAAYVDAVDAAFGTNVDYGQIVKPYEAEPVEPGRYSPPRVVSATRMAVWGHPDPEHISTSYVERNNLTMRMQVRRLTRLTNCIFKDGGKPAGAGVAALRALQLRPAAPNDSCDSCNACGRDGPRVESARAAGRSAVGAN
jgi:IS1 family transposase